MAAPPVTDEAFFELVSRSGVLSSKRLNAYLSSRRPGAGGSGEARAAAQAAVSDGLLTKYQAEQLLTGRWRNFLCAGKYLILERVGHGGMSAIFLANHLAVQRPVALKVLPANKAENPEALARFYREARAAAMLDHPNIADFYDIYRTDNLHFLVMEFIHGPDLEGLVARSGPLSPTRATEYIRQAASGLQHAHEVGLVHRDIKPGNLLVDRSGTVKILDLGLVRIFQSDDGLTKGQNFRYVLGTIDYQAPEQAVDSHEVDIRADIYSLGATFYFLLTGQTVFPEGSIAEKLTWHQRRQPRPISDYRDDVPAGLAAVVDRMMAKSPSDRYPEPADVVEALAEWAHEPIPPPSEAELPPLSKAARALLDSRPRRSPQEISSLARRGPSLGLATPPPALATPPPAAEKPAAIATDSAVRASDPVPTKPWLRRRTALIVAASVAAIAFAGSRTGGLISEWSQPAPTSAATSGPRPLQKSAPISLFDSVADLNTQIASETTPANQADLLVRRGNSYSRLGRWRQAAGDFRRALDLDPDNQWTWYAAIPTLVEIGDLDSYRKRCLEMQERFESSDDTLLSERIAKLWLLTPKCPGDPAIPTRLVDRASASEATATKRLYYWVMSTKGIAEYRAGRPAEAVPWLKKAIDAAPPTTLQCKALSGLFLSMALQRQNLQDPARQEYDRAAEILDRHQSQYGGDLGAEWCDWLMCQIIRREAEETLGLVK
jgi:serine/threonine protein kinase